MHKYCAAVKRVCVCLCEDVCVCVCPLEFFTGGIILCLPWLIMQLIMWLRSQKCEDYAAVRRRLHRNLITCLRARRPNGSWSWSH